MATLDALTAERVARNDSRFREANEQIEQRAQALGFRDTVPFICECADESCTAVLQLGLAEYESVRSSPVQFVVALGHERAGAPFVRVVRGVVSYLIVEKLGEAAEIAAQLDPRS